MANPTNLIEGDHSSVPPPTSPIPTIAVLAIHGVADQKPDESARAIAGLLLSVHRGLDTRFTSFREFGVALPSRRVDIQVTSPSSAGVFDLRAEFLRQNQDETISDVDYWFMRDLLGEYRQAREDGVYRTVRLEGGRLGDDGAERKGRANVHIYEAYWADLSRVSERLYRIVGELYQLLLHLPFLGLQAIDFRLTASEGPEKTWWSRDRRLYASCLRIFTLPIPILNILMLAIGLTLLPARIAARSHPWVAVVTVAILLLIGSSWYVLRYREARSPWAWLPGLMVTIVGAIVTARAVGFFTSSGPVASGLYVQLGIVWWLASGGLLLPVFRHYDRHVPGALWVAVSLYTLVITPVLVWSLHGRYNSEVGFDQAILRTLEITFSLLWLAWLILAPLATWHLLRGWWARKRRSSFAYGTPGSRALFTSRLALSLSISIFSQVTVLLWAALLTTVAPLLVSKDQAYAPFLFIFKPVAPVEQKVSGFTTVGAFLADILNVNGAPIFISGVVLSTLVALIVLWAMGPSALAELFPPPPPVGSAGTARARREGLWLSSGIRFMRLAGEMACIGVVLGTLMALVTVGFRAAGSPIDWDNLLCSRVGGLFCKTPDVLLLGLSVFGVVTGTVAGLFALGRLANGLALGFRPVLDVLLDVDNYLREHPRDQTPRARIAARYTTLLRHICRWRDPSPGANGAPYAALIIIAHSQGTVITADLLRFLRCERSLKSTFEPELDRLLSDPSVEGGQLPVYFFTMGCPLRQLYHRRFPDLYRWVGPPGGAVGPHPDSLGVKRWVNVYRSGDYVGRNLWTSDTDPELFDPSVPLRTDGIRSEGCIGAGAHTHYWDDSAPTVGEELDRLILEAIAVAT